MLATEICSSLNNWQLLNFYAAIIWLCLCQMAAIIELYLLGLFGTGYGRDAWVTGKWIPFDWRYATAFEGVHIDWAVIKMQDCQWHLSLIVIQGLFYHLCAQPACFLDPVTSSCCSDTTMLYSLKCLRGRLKPLYHATAESRFWCNPLLDMKRTDSAPSYWG